MRTATTHRRNAISSFKPHRSRQKGNDECQERAKFCPRLNHSAEPNNSPEPDRVPCTNAENQTAWDSHIAWEVGASGRPSYLAAPGNPPRLSHPAALFTSDSPKQSVTCRKRADARLRELSEYPSHPPKSTRIHHKCYSSLEMSSVSAH